MPPVTYVCPNALLPCTRQLALGTPQQQTRTHNTRLNERKNHSYFGWNYKKRTKRPFLIGKAGNENKIKGFSAKKNKEYLELSRKVTPFPKKKSREKRASPVFQEKPMVLTEARAVPMAQGQANHSHVRVKTLPTIWFATSPLCKVTIT